MKKILLASAAVLAASFAQAADLPTAALKAPVVATPWFNWANAYMGMEAGGVAGPNTDNTPTGAGTMGMNFAIAGTPFIYGFEMDAGAAKTTAPALSTFGFTGNGSIRLGYAIHPNLTIAGMKFTDDLLYVKANAAVLDLSGLLASGMKIGPGFSAGVENVVAACTTLGPEYRWSDVSGVRSNTYVMVMRVYGGC